MIDVLVNGRTGKMTKGLSRSSRETSRSFQEHRTMSHDPLMSPRERFEGYYAAPQVPWDIGRPQRVFLEAEQAIARLPNGRRCRVLDIGCGTGDLSLWLAERGCTVTGIDFLSWPIQRAKQKASDRGLTVNFLQMDALAIGQIPERFDSVTDCGLFHVFDDSSRAAYVAALSNLLEPGASLFVVLLQCRTRQPWAEESEPRGVAGNLR